MKNLSRKLTKENIEDVITAYKNLLDEIPLMHQQVGYDTTEYRALELAFFKGK